jgi:AcrR family transcriptional regulator
MCIVILMSQGTNIPAGSPRERIMAIASELFYRQGYRATGINEVIEKSGVAKATFYKHFPTKDDLCLTYLRDRNTTELAEIDDFINTRKKPLTRFLSVMEALEPWMLASGMKGCAFLNMVPEVPDTDSPLRREGAIHYERLRTRVRELAEDLLRTEPEKYGQLNPETVANDYMVILTGAIALSEISQDIWPIKQGIETVKRLLK